MLEEWGESGDKHLVSSPTQSTGSTQFFSNAGTFPATKWFHPDFQIKPVSKFPKRPPYRITPSDAISSLPLELVAEIFRQCAPNDSWPYHESHRTRGSTLFKLGGVCTFWRYLIWSQAPFWTFLPVILRPENITDTAGMVKDWVKRARDLNIDFTVILDAAVEHSLSHFTRAKLWDRLGSAYDDELGIEDHIETARPWNYPHHTGWQYVNPAHEPITAHSLEALSFARVSLKSLTFCKFWNLKLGSPNLATATVKDANLDDIWTLLRCAPQLCALHIQENRHSPHAVLRRTAPPIVHHSLTELSISALESTYVEEILTRGVPEGPEPMPSDTGFRLPALKKLSIDAAIGPLNHSNLVDFFRSSGCGNSLEELSVHAAFSVRNELDVRCGLVHVLKVASRLTALRLVPNLYSDPAFSAESLFEYMSQTSPWRAPDAILDSNLSDAATVSHDTFLPALKSFEYSPVTPEECDKIWDLIPDLFGTVGHFDTEINSSMRPLKSVRISYRPGTHNLRRPPPEFKAQTLVRIHRLIKGRNVRIVIESNHAEVWDDDGNIHFPGMRSTLPIQRAL